MKLNKDTTSLQACGSFDPLVDKYSISIAIEGALKGPTVALESGSDGSLCVSFDCLSREDLEHLESCISCMLTTDIKN